MRTLTSASFGLALALSAFAFGSAPASAIEVQAAVSQSAVAGDATNVQWSPRCRRWRHYCHNLHPLSRWKFRRCLIVHGCSY
jgi:hypothetical protein